MENIEKNGGESQEELKEKIYNIIAGLIEKNFSDYKDEDMAAAIKDKLTKEGVDTSGFEIDIKGYEDDLKDLDGQGGKIESGLRVSIRKGNEEFFDNSFPTNEHLY